MGLQYIEYAAYKIPFDFLSIQAMLPDERCDLKQTPPNQYQQTGPK